MLSIYIIIVVSGLAAAGLSFLTWIILLLSFGGAAITASVIAAIGLTYFLLHLLLLLNLRSFFFTHRSNPGNTASSAPAWVGLVSGISSALKRSPALRKAAWGVLAGAAVLLLLAKPAAGSQSGSD